MTQHTPTPPAIHAPDLPGRNAGLVGIIGVIGVGNMGLAMALRLLDTGHAVQVHDLLPAREALATAAGARPADTPAALAAACSVVIVAVVDAAQVDAVLFAPQGLAQARPLPHTVLLCPTIAPEDVARFGARLAALGVACIDAPMSGGPARARAGRMSLMLAGAAEVLARHAPLLDMLSDQQVVVGQRLGDGARTKLVNNLLAAINLAGACEVMALAQQMGLDAGTTLAVIERSSGQSWIGSDRLHRALAGDLAPQAHTRLLAKDSGLAIAMAQEAGIRPALGSAAARLFAQACAAGLAEQDDGVLLAWLATRQTPPAEPPG